ncbi:MAG: segregation/condensation protein A [Acidobacteriia bacterium]|nr:segregation/condensation protein A [Terriglobia bacterium]
MDGTENPETNGTSREEPGLTIRLEGFEGPLDLLLHLIKREELDIWNIPIAHITEQYLGYLQLMQDLNINVAGEWLLMAATLIYIKSRMLLPPDPVQEAAEGEAQDDPRKELVYQLLEHQKFRNAAQMLYTREEVENAVWNSPPRDVLEDGKEVVAVTLFDLLKAFADVVKRFEAQAGMELDQEEVTIEQKLAEMRRLLMVHDSLVFSSFFTRAVSKSHMIVTFLALLELVRLREIWLYQEKAFEEIHITRSRSAGETA